MLGHGSCIFRMGSKAFNATGSDSPRLLPSVDARVAGSPDSVAPRGYFGAFRRCFSDRPVRCALGSRSIQHIGAGSGYCVPSRTARLPDNRISVPRGRRQCFPRCRTSRRALGARIDVSGVRLLRSGVPRLGHCCAGLRVGSAGGRSAVIASQCGLGVLACLGLPHRYVGAAPIAQAFDPPLGYPPMFGIGGDTFLRIYNTGARYIRESRDKVDIA